MASKIEDYGLIGNLHTAALVSRSGSIDWLCGPRFDSDAFFASLVGYDEHGSWSLSPTGAIRETRQRYRDETMILETEFLCDEGIVRLTDFMPVGQGHCEVVRILDGFEKFRWKSSSTCASATGPMLPGSRRPRTVSSSSPDRMRSSSGLPCASKRRMAASRRS
jgi:GH15 family glucan-1,4-alpha-glucosidase